MVFWIYLQLFEENCAQFYFGTINILRKLLHVIYESSLRTREQFFLSYVNAESDEALTVEIIQDVS